MDLYIYSTPAEAAVELALDDGRVFAGVACVANGRDDAHRITMPDNMTGQGSVLRVRCSGCLPFENRGIFDPGGPRFVLDDVRLAPEPAPPEPPPPPNPHADPFAIISAVYEQGDYDLAEKEGCGEYTEACCLALHTQQSSMWGHIMKTGAQNQYNGHAVDAVQLLARAGETQAGIYDIILDTESPDAKPAWSFKGPPDPDLWLEPT